MGVSHVREDQKEIVNYIKDHFVGWLEEKKILPFSTVSEPINPQLLERIVRVEENIKHQNDNIEKLMVQMDRRFSEQREETNRRFDDMDKRLNRQTFYQLATFTAIVSSAVAILMQGL